MLHVSEGISENCVNEDSYGAICVHCNRCGRFNKEDKMLSEKTTATTVNNKDEMQKYLESCKTVESHDETLNQNLQDAKTDLLCAVVECLTKFDVLFAELKTAKEEV